MKELLSEKKLNLFWWFITERQLIWYRRNIKKLPYPWTNDVVLKEHRFTNIYRELDPGTVYAIEKILESKNSKPDKIFNIMIYRLLGKKETHAKLGFQTLKNYSQENFIRTLKEVQKKEPPFTAAYMVGGYTKMGTRDKIVNIGRLFANLRDNFDKFYNLVKESKTPQDVYLAICSNYGYGNFLSYQVFVDLCYPLKDYDQKGLLPFSNNEWAAAGPGAQRGISLLVKENINHLKVMKWLRDNQVNELNRLNLDFPFIKDKQGNSELLSLANIQNSLCEFHKYVKIKNGTGRARRKFKSK